MPIGTNYVVVARGFAFNGKPVGEVEVPATIREVDPEIDERAAVLSAAEGYARKELKGAAHLSLGFGKWAVGDMLRGDEKPLGRFDSDTDALDFARTLPGAETGRYYIDPPTPLTEAA